MGIGDRLQIALQSEVGALLLGLLGFTLVLALIYLYLSQKKKRSDLLGYRHQAHFAEAESKLRDFSFTTPHKSAFFGRETIGKGAHGYALCRIAPPKLAKQEAVERFASFHRATRGQALPSFSRYQLHSGSLTLQEGLLTEKGVRLPTALELVADAILTEAETEELLLDVTRALAALHSLSAENGGTLYHGFLLPQNLYIDLDPQNKVRNILIADCGMVFSLGSDLILDRIEELRKGTSEIETFSAKQLLEQVAMLAPEQLDRERVREVGPASDFYTFGALAVTLFTRERFSSGPVAWDRVPSKWHPFLKRCLAENPLGRPTDFHEITDWLFDPELALTRHEGAHKEIQVGEAKADSYELSDLKGMLGKMQASKRRQTCALPPAASRFLAKAQSAIAQSKWSVASGFLAKAKEAAPDHPEVLLALAIAHYEQGETREAEALHKKVAALDPHVARRFHEHLASKR